MTQIAVSHNAQAVVVRIKTPHELAIKRITSRQETEDSMQKNPEKAREIVERFARAIEESGDDENVVTISGTDDFLTQMKVFRQGIL